MFSGSFSIWHWLIVLVIVIAIFGTKKLAGAGSDLGAAVKNFKKAMHEGEQEAESKPGPDALEADPKPDAAQTVQAAQAAQPAKPPPTAAPQEHGKV